LWLKNNTTQPSEKKLELIKVIPLRIKPNKEKKYNRIVFIHYSNAVSHFLNYFNCSNHVNKYVYLPTNKNKKRN